MKTIQTILTASAVILALGVNSVNAAEGNKKEGMKTEMNHDGKHEDCMMMKDGKMMVMKGGKWMAMEKEMTCKNGEKVMTDGTVMKKDGKKMMLKEGEGIDMDGKMMDAKKMNEMMMKHDKMK
jgi:hypothetical protein